jgi:hypothetical protein
MPDGTRSPSGFSVVETRAGRGCRQLENVALLGEQILQGFGEGARVPPRICNPRSAI